MYHKLIDTDSYSLHVVQGSLKIAVNKNSLRIKKALEGAFHLLHDTRLEDKTTQHWKYYFAHTTLW